MESTDKDNAVDGVYKDSGWNTSWDDPQQKTYTTYYLTGYFVITVGKLDASGKPNQKLTDEELANIHSMFKIEGYKAGDVNGNPSNNGSVNNEATKDTMVSVGHRGWYKAPENTLAAYRESYNHGFKYVECDVQFTKDGVPVLLHDDTIDRTSNGSGYLSQMTYAEVSKYDFSYDDSDSVNDFSAYRGEKIPTFVEFIALCKELNLHPYIEIKGTMTDDEARVLIKIVNDAGMTDRVSWLGFSGDALSKIAHNCPTARLVWVITDTNAAKIKENNIPFAQMNLMTGQNQVVFDIWYTLATQDVVDLLKGEGIPLEVWTVNDINAIKNLNPYVTGVSSDYYNAKEVLKNAGIER
jgi:glycerophosphoryl diester phosphodiesterase